MQTLLNDKVLLFTNRLPTILKSNIATHCNDPTGGDDCSPRGKVIHADGSGQMRIYSPSTISALQAHLASSDPELGAPLENLVNLPTLGLPLSRMHPDLIVFSVLPRQGAAPGRASSHWESRVLRGSIMAPVLGDPVTVRIDPVTLAALQDTGWYTVDLSRAQSLVWGSGKAADV